MLNMIIFLRSTSFFYNILPRVITNDHPMAMMLYHMRRPDAGDINYRVNYTYADKPNKILADP